MERIATNAIAPSGNDMTALEPSPLVANEFCKHDRQPVRDSQESKKGRYMHGHMAPRPASAPSRTARLARAIILQDYGDGAQGHARTTAR